VVQNKAKKPDENDEIRPHKRNRNRKFVIDVEIEKEDFYLGKISERCKEKRDCISFLYSLFSHRVFLVFFGKAFFSHC